MTCDETSVSRGRFRLPRPAKPWPDAGSQPDENRGSAFVRGRVRILARLFARVNAWLGGGREIVLERGLDDRARRDIGIGTDGLIGVSDVRTAFDRRLLERGQPWP